MNDIAQAASMDRYHVRMHWHTVFLFFVGVLASTVMLKLGSVQYLELLYFCLIFVLLIYFAATGFRVKVAGILFWLAIAYVLFSLAALSLSVAALRYDFYIPYPIDPIRVPVVITITRIIELTASLAALIYMTQLFGRNIGRLRFTMKVYFWTGVASAVYSILSFPLQFFLHVEFLGTYSAIHRMRGFYNEGGPYGLYMLSVLFVGFALDRLGWSVARRNHRLIMTMLCIPFVLSYSKAGMFCVVFIFALNSLFASSFKARLLILASGVTVVVLLSYFINFAGVIRGYKQTTAAYERLSHKHAKDLSFAYGRVAASFIVPRMIKAHPLTGIGWGNYGVLRNAPQYRGTSVFADHPDDPALGLYGLAAELGLPLVTFLLLLLLTPFIYLRSIHAPPWLANLAMVQPLCHLFGAQLNLTYPWIVTAFALGLGLNLARQGASFPAQHEAPLS